MTSMAAPVHAAVVTRCGCPQIGSRDVQGAGTAAPAAAPEAARGAGAAAAPSAAPPAAAAKPQPQPAQQARAQGSGLEAAARPAAPRVTAIGLAPLQLLSGAKFGLKAPALAAPRRVAPAPAEGAGGTLSADAPAAGQPLGGTAQSASLSTRAARSRLGAGGGAGLEAAEAAGSGFVQARVAADRPAGAQHARGSSVAAHSSRPGSHPVHRMGAAAGPAAALSGRVGAGGADTGRGSGSCGVGPVGEDPSRGDRAAARRTQAAADRAHNAAVLACAAGDEEFARRVAEEEVAQVTDKEQNLQRCTNLVKGSMRAACVLWQRGVWPRRR